MKKLLTAVFGAVIVTAVAASSAFAAYDFGQLGSGDIYRVRNLSDNQTDFVKTANADLCETVQFKVRVHNAGPKTLTNVKVKVMLPNGVATSHTSTATVTADNNRENAVATGSASVALSQAGSLNYVSGSAELLDTNGAKLGSLSNSLVTTGVNIGSVAVSLNNMRFVQFKAKINCPEVPGNITVCELATKTIVSIKESEFNSSKYTRDLSQCEETPVIPTELPQTGATGLIGIVAAVVTAGIGYAVTARKNLLG